MHALAAVAARDLPVHELRRAVDLREQIREQFCQLVAVHRDVDLEGGCRRIEAVEVLLKQEHLAVGAHGCVVHAVAEVVRTVVERHRQLFRRSSLPVVICNAFHIECPFRHEKQVGASKPARAIKNSNGGGGRISFRFAK